MRIQLNYKDDTLAAVKSVKMVCSVTESLMIADALRTVVNDEETHPSDKKLAREMLSDWRDFMDSIYQDRRAE